MSLATGLARSTQNARWRSTSAIAGAANPDFPVGPSTRSRRRRTAISGSAAEKGLVRFDGLTFRLIDAGAGDQAPGRRCSAWPARRTAACGRGCGASASSATAAGAFDNLLGAPGRAAFGGHRDGSRPRRRDAAGDARPRRHGLPRRALRARHGAGDAARRRSSSRSPRPPTATSGSAPATPACSGSAARTSARDRRRAARSPRSTACSPRRPARCGSGRIAAWRAGTARRSRRRGCRPALRTTPALSMTRDRDSNLWVAAGAGGLLRVDPNGRVHAAIRGRSSLGHVTAIFEDRDGNLWVGTDSRHRTLARSRVHDVLESAGPAIRRRRARSCGRGRAGLVRPVARRAVLDPRRPGTRGEGGRAGGRRRLLDPRRRERGVGRPAARRRHACFASATAASRAERYTQRDGLAQDSVYAIHRTRDGACGPAR